MAQPVRVDGRQPGPPGGARDDLADRGRGEAAVRRQHPHEHAAACGARGTAAAQVSDDRLADISRQRQPLLATALAAHDELAGPPVEVVEPKRGHLAGPQPEPRQQREDGVIAHADVGVPIAGGEQRAHLAGLERPR